MFYHIDGKVTNIEPHLAVIDCAGVGYALYTTNNTISQLKIGEKSKLYTYLNVREDCFDLYGFYTLSEKRCFEMLLGVSGVGPKAAISILSASTPESLAMAIINGDDKALTVAQGIGKKIAQRVILELKDKMAKDSQGLSLAVDSSATAAPANGGKLSDAAAALSVLGYGNAEISLAMRDINVDDLPLKEIIRAALKKMVK